MGKKFQKVMLSLLGGVILLHCGGCATMVGGGSNQPVTLNSEPSGAMLRIYDKKGDIVHSGMTPMTVTLKRGAGFFQGQKYRVYAEKEGYASNEDYIKTNLNGWYLGNVLFGGLIGLLIVDPATGAMYQLDKEFTITLTPNKVTSISSLDPSSGIISMDEVPKEWKPYLRKL